MIESGQNIKDIGCDWNATQRRITNMISGHIFLYWVLFGVLGSIICIKVELWACLKNRCVA